MSKSFTHGIKMDIKDMLVLILIFTKSFVGSLEQDENGEHKLINYLNHFKSYFLVRSYCNWYMVTVIFTNDLQTTGEDIIRNLRDGVK